MQDWPETLKEILYGDLAAAFAYRTPAGGVVALPVTTIGMFDEEAATVTTSTSLGNWKKLVRIDEDNRVAMIYHVRDHGKATAPNFVVVQGRARFPTEPDSKWITREVVKEWNDRLLPRKTGPVSNWLGREYYDRRVPITVDIHRILIWPDADASGEPEVIGEPLPAEPPPPQAPPKNGTESRVSPTKIEKRLKRTAHAIVGYADSDGFPIFYPTEIAVEGDHLSLSRKGMAPGGRRAGVLSHWFSPKLIGQASAILTGWLEVDAGDAIYRPHTMAGYAIPESKLAFSYGGSITSKLGYRKAVKLGLVRDGVWQGAPS